MYSQYDKLNGGSVARLREYRRDLARSLETIRGCRTPEAAAEFIRNAGYTSPLNYRYSWMGDAHGIDDQLRDAAKESRGYVSAPWGLVDGWRDVGDSGDILGRGYSGWYADADCDETYRGHVWQLPARNGSPQYVAGYVEDQGRSVGETRAGGYVVLCVDRGALELFDDKEDAARAGDGLAERNAERDREYSGRWREASNADSERDDARDDLKSARGSARSIIAALRELPPLAQDVPDAFSVARAQLRASLDDARGDMRRALAAIKEAAEKIAELDMTGEF
jgi:hypothetical protein